MLASTIKLWLKHFESKTCNKRKKYRKNPVKDKKYQENRFFF